jgi:hypothetical protein
MCMDFYVFEKEREVGRFGRKRGKKRKRILFCGCIPVFFYKGIMFNEGNN